MPRPEVIGKRLLQLRIPEPLFQDLRALARSTDSTMSAFVRGLIEKAVVDSGMDREG